MLSCPGPREKPLRLSPRKCPKSGDFPPEGLCRSEWIEVSAYTLESRPGRSFGGTWSASLKPQHSLASFSWRLSCDRCGSALWCWSWECSHPALCGFSYRETEPEGHSKRGRFRSERFAVQR